MQMRIFNLNILSTKLSDPMWHKHCKPEYLKTEHRWNLLKSALLFEISHESIVCLQELSEEWLSLLIPFFSFHAYTFVYDSQSLGVGTAFQTSKYDLLNVKIISVGESIGKKCVAFENEEKTNSRYYLFQMFVYWMKKKFWDRITDANDAWNRATKRKNRVVSVGLLDKKHVEIMTVFNYHMPCLFASPNVMNVHACELMSIVQQYSYGKSFVLAGDFNSQPNSDVYKLITQGLIPTLPVSKFFKHTPQYIGLPSMASVYNNREPLFTNNSGSHNRFTGTIDYIFHSSHFECESTGFRWTEIPKRPFPNNVQMSDHIPIVAILKKK